MRFLCFLLAVLSLGLGACRSGTEAPPMSPQAAAQDRTPRRVRITRVHDQMESRVVSKVDAMVTHYVEVVVVSGPDRGKPLALPYDEVNVGRAPPAVDSEVVMAPADWVRRDPRAMMRTFTGDPGNR
jgi:hypothetical protein